MLLLLGKRPFSYGADAIAEFMYGKKECRRTVYNLIQNKSIPHFRIGATCTRASPFS
ncbi:MAG: hypothetical protein QOF14_5813 [Hyphomicrobiales bacterium]|jgi:hypothetical protein|nr:hypothetical protein [Hyphomicrobiales bacterium]